MSIIKAVANTSWGWRKKDLKKVWTSDIRSVAAGGWQPLISRELVEKLTRVQHKGLRLIKILKYKQFFSLILYYILVMT